MEPVTLSYLAEKNLKKYSRSFYSSNFNIEFLTLESFYNKDKEIYTSKAKFIISNQITEIEFEHKPTLEHITFDKNPYYSIKKSYQKFEENKQAIAEKFYNMEKINHNLEIYYQISEMVFNKHKKNKIFYKEEHVFNKIQFNRDQNHFIIEQEEVKKSNQYKYSSTKIKYISTDLELIKEEITIKKLQKNNQVSNFRLNLNKNNEVISKELFVSQKGNTLNSFKTRKDSRHQIEYKDNNQIIRLSEVIDKKEISKSFCIAFLKSDCREDEFHNISISGNLSTNGFSNIELENSGYLNGNSFEIYNTIDKDILYTSEGRELLCLTEDFDIDYLEKNSTYIKKIEKNIEKFDFVDLDFPVINNIEEARNVFEIYEKELKKGNLIFKELNKTITNVHNQKLKEKNA